MQLGSKEICKIISEEYPEYPLEFLLNLDKFIFSTLRYKLNNATSLIYDISPLGKFSFRRKETQRYVYHYMDYKDDEYMDNMKHILNMYEEYVEDKKNKKYERFGKESHDAYLLAKKEKNIQRKKEAESKKHP